MTKRMGIYHEKKGVHIKIKRGTFWVPESIRGQECYHCRFSFFFKLRIKLSRCLITKEITE